MGRNAEPEYDVASCLVIYFVPYFRKCLDCLSSRKDRKLRH